MMIIGRGRFNLYLLIAVAGMLACGCQFAHKRKKQEPLASLRIHMEVVPDMMDFSTKVPINRAKPVMINVDKAPFLTELNLTEARVVDVPGGFDLEVKFDRQGTWVLEQYTTVNRGKHMAIFSAFGDHKLKQQRWLAAPIISQRLSKGVLSFAPDSSREEAEIIVTGLSNNISKVRSEETKW